MQVVTYLAILQILKLLWQFEILIKIGPDGA